MLLPILALLSLAAEVSVPGPAEAYLQEVLGTTLSIEMTPITGGVLTQGEAGGVELAPFYMATRETTWDLYDVFVFGYDRPRGTKPVDGVTRPTKPYIAADHGFGHAGFPALSISHNGAVAFCKWLSVKTGRKYRLPTEVEWEWASRAGAATRWFFGDDEERLGEFAWLRTNSRLVTHPVAKKEASPWGLHDIYGNVAEWCATSDDGHVLRGGSYLDRWKKMDSAVRKIPTPAWNANDPQIPQSIWWLTDGSFAGFRVVCEMDAGSPAVVEAPGD